MSCIPSFPHATNQTLLAKFKQQHEENKFFVGTPVMEPAFIIRHFAGKVKYQIKVRGRSDGHKKNFLAFLGVCQDVENVLGVGWIRRVLRGILGLFFGWQCRLEGNPHYYSEQMKQGDIVVPRACFAGFQGEEHGLHEA